MRYKIVFGFALMFLVSVMSVSAVSKTYFFENPTTHAKGTGVDVPKYFLNYTINDTTSSVVMQVKHGNISAYNISVTSSCLNYAKSNDNKLQFYWFTNVFSDSGGWRGSSSFSCKTGVSSWTTISTFSPVQTIWSATHIGAYGGGDEGKIVDGDYNTESFYEQDATPRWARCNAISFPTEPCVMARVFEDSMYNTIVCDPSYICDGGVYVFEPNANIYPSTPDINSGLSFNYSVSSNPSDWASPVSVTSVEVYYEWLADGVPTTCGGGCPSDTVFLSDTEMYVLDLINGSDLDPDVTYSINVTAVMTNGSTYGEEVSNDAYADPSGFPDPCGDGTCDSGIGESGFSCASDCHSGSSGSFDEDGGSYLRSGQVGTGLENLNTGQILTVSGNIVQGVPSYSSWSFIFINRVGVGGSLG